MSKKNVICASKKILYSSPFFSALKTNLPKKPAEISPEKLGIATASLSAAAAGA